MKNRYSQRELEANIAKVLQSDVKDSQLLKESIEEIVETVNIYHQELTYQNEELMRTNMELSSLKDKYQLLFHEAPISYVLFNGNDWIVEANQTFCRRVGVVPSLINSHKITEYILPEHQDTFYFMKNRLMQGSEKEVIELQLYTSEKEICDVNVISKPFHCRTLYGEEKKETLYCAIIHDITQIRNQQNEILKMSYHDAMTGLYNRRFYIKRIKELEDDLSNLPVSIASIDLDGLKIINDTLGHEYGDKAIMTICDILEKNVLKEWNLIRMGGDEICLLCPKTSKEKLSSFLQKIEVIVGEHEVQGIPLSVSYGVAARTSPYETLDIVAALSEDIMYSRKVLQSPQQKNMIVSMMLEKLFTSHPKIERHSLRVQELAIGFAKYLEMDEYFIDEIARFAYLHDIGMVGIDDYVIEKQKDFSDEEIKEFYRHPQIGNRIIRSMFGYEEIATAELYHHEWWNGRGYPYGLKGEDIPYMARFITIVDSYDWHKLELGYDESEGLTMEDIEAYYTDNKATRFDPEICDQFLAFMRKQLEN